MVNVMAQGTEQERPLTDGQNVTDQTISCDRIDYVRVQPSM